MTHVGYAMLFHFIIHLRFANLMGGVPAPAPTTAPPTVEERNPSSFASQPPTNIPFPPGLDFGSILNA